MIEHGAGARRIVGVGFAILIRLVGGTGEGDVGSGNVVIELVRHRPHEAQVIGDAGRMLQKLAQKHSVMRSCDGLERSPNLGGGRWLRVPQVVVTRTTLQQDENATPRRRLPLLTLMIRQPN
jgi:hypothetical protein